MVSTIVEKDGCQLLKGTQASVLFELDMLKIFSASVLCLYRYEEKVSSYKIHIPYKK